LILARVRFRQFSGNYDTFEQTLNEQQENQMKKYSKEQVDIAKMKEYVARFGHGSRKLAKQGKSKEKLLNKRLAEGLTEAVYREKTVSFKFPEVSALPSPVMMVQGVSFRYNETTPWIYDDLEFGMDLDTRVALVGPNGAGKSTLLKVKNTLISRYNFLLAYIWRALANRRYDSSTQSFEDRQISSASRRPARLGGYPS
jgi:ATP-binding cassette subfamily F protein 2